MKVHQKRIVSCLAMFAAFALAGQASAASYTYDTSVGVNAPAGTYTFAFDDDASWLGVGRPNAAGDVATLGGGNILIATFASDVTVGRINYSPTSERPLTLRGASNKLTFDNSGSDAAVLGTRNPVRGLTITASEIALNSNLVIGATTATAMSSTRSTVITGAITGPGGLTIRLNESDSGPNNRFLQLFASAPTIQSTFAGGATIIGSGTNLTRPVELQTNHDNAFGTGTLSLSGNLIWTMTDSHTVADFVFNGSPIGLTGTFDATALNTRYTTSAFSGGGTMTIVPEPATTGMVLLGMAGLAFRRRPKSLRA